VTKMKGQMTVFCSVFVN